MTPSGDIHLPLDDLVGRLFAPGWADLRTADGAELRAELVSASPLMVTVLAPRLVLDRGLEVHGVVQTPDPWSVTFSVESVEPYSPSSETAVLRAVRSSLYPERRRWPRVEVGGEAVVTVHHGVEMVEEERLRAVLANVSACGLAFASGVELAPGAQVTLDARLLAGRLRADVVVRWCGPSRMPGMHLYGSEIRRLHAGAETLDALLLAAGPQEAPELSVNLQELRDTFAEPRRRTLRGLLRRRDG
jgi:PilZ domain-containing protein